MLKMKYPIILASQSPVRRQLLERAGLIFTVKPSSVDEDALKPAIEHLSIPDQALFLSHEKAKDISAKHPGALVLAADQIGEFQGQPLFKPGNAERNFEILKKLQNQSHHQHTAVCLYHQSKCSWEHVETTTLHMRALSDEHIRAYVAADTPFNACGGYRFEGLGKHLYRSVEGDVDSILGLPMLKILNTLQDQKLLIMDK